jgi:predicted LPLAT superfamily acyltransferase
MSAAWRRRPEVSQRWALRLMSWIALRLGRRAARLVLHPITAYYLLFAPRARRASLAYLRRALGRAPGLADRYRHFHAFAATILDRVYLLHGRFGLFELEAHGEAELRAHLGRGAGVLLLGAHLGSFEALRALGRRREGLRVAMVMYEDNARMLNETLAAISPAARQDVIALGRFDSMLRVRDSLAAGGAVGVLGDRGLDDEDVLELPFLGAAARFPLGPLRMASMLRCKVVFMAGLYLGGPRYALHFEPIADFGTAPLAASAESALAAYVACLERHCRAAPYNWFNFYDFWGDAAAR